MMKKVLLFSLVGMTALADHRGLPPLPTIELVHPQPQARTPVGIPVPADIPAGFLENGTPTTVTFGTPTTTATNTPTTTVTTMTMAGVMATGAAVMENHRD